MRSLFLLLIFLTPVFLRAQPGERYHQLYLGIYTPEGKTIDSTGKRYLVNFTDSGSNQKIDYQYSNKRFGLKLPTGSVVKVNISDLASGSVMILHTSGSLDSIVFRPGEFSFDRYESFLFGIQAFDARIINKEPKNFLAGQPRNFPRYSQEYASDEEKHDESKACYKMAESMEALHGGKNWIRNACNDVFEEYVHSSSAEVQERIDIIEAQKHNEHLVTVYPYKQHTYLRHDFYRKHRYVHTISISTDGCLSWKPLFRIIDEWYVSLMYFPGSDQIGIDISNSGVVLLSQNGITDWKFYLVDESDEPPTPRTEVLLLKNTNWMDDVFEKFYFSE